MTVTSRSLISIGKDYYISEHSSMGFIQSNDRKGRYEFRAIQKSCKMRSMYKNQIGPNKKTMIATCKSVIHTQQWQWLIIEMFDVVAFLDISLKLETSLGTPVDLTLTQTLSLLINNFDLVRSWSGGSWLRASWEDSHYIGNCTGALGIEIIKCQYLGELQYKDSLGWYYYINWWMCWN